MKLICGICEIDDGDTLHIYDARTGHPIHIKSIVADGETTHVLPINAGDCVVIVPYAAMRTDERTVTVPIADTAPLAVVDTAPLAVVDTAPLAVVDTAPLAVVENT